MASTVNESVSVIASSATTTTTTKKHTTDLQEVQETVSRLASHKSVMAVLILNKSGDIVTQSGGGDGAIGNPKLLAKVLEAANLYAASLPGVDNDLNQETLATPTAEEVDEDSAESEGGVDNLLEAMKTSQEEHISFVRMRTPKHEILVAPKFGYTLVVFQDPSVASL